MAIVHEGMNNSNDETDKGAWGMSWHQKALKGVENCEKPRVAVKQAVIRGFPNSYKLNS